ncbi:MAG: 23S rRNA (adenine(2503)-C(2))-methyltransferase RlmN [Endomicrobium sp.]|jgi:23S rRNA (adenine2503-C2)-methyltransferase|nr:23S rRNA (adenine(2503)-C(2))-methyltransferase RlmN [Endomicrobium sp.]
MKNYVLDMTKNRFKMVVKQMIGENYRFDQIMRWIYIKKKDSFDNFTDLPNELRKKLSEKFFLRILKIINKKESIVDGTIKYTFKTIDKKYFSAVFIPSDDKNSICVSSQIGCSAICTFCYSGKIKFERNLSGGEILEQILQIENDTRKKISRVLFMGTGEPMLNYSNIDFALNLLLSNKEFNIGKRHIVVSTIGIVPEIKKLADRNLGVRLALSLHAVDERVRKKMVSNNFGFLIEDILDAGKYFLKKTNSRLTIEYVLIKNINSSSKDAHKLARLLMKHDLINYKTNVNLIPFNSIAYAKFQPPSDELIKKFKNVLKFNRINSNVRKAKGVDINSACGQLGIFDSN